MRTGGVVLAGGRSSRMGRPKALLPWHGRPLVAHVAASLSTALAGGPVVVVRAPSQTLPRLPDGVLVTEDAVAGRGPLQGLVAGLDALRGRADAAVVVATDQPFVAGAVARLTAALHDADDAVAFRVEGRLQPLGALYRSRVQAAARRRSAGDDGSLQGLLRSVSTRVLEATVDDAACLRSLDTPEAYAEALRGTLRA